MYSPNKSPTYNTSHLLLSGNYYELWCMQNSEEELGQVD
jgi:hypothetical protein